MHIPPEHLTAEGRDSQLDEAGLAPVWEVKPLVFNANNSATGVVELLGLTDGSQVVRKVLHSGAPVTVRHWAAGHSTGHWNFWRRESDAYLERARSAPGGSLIPAHGLRAPQLLGRVAPSPAVEVLFLEHVEGRSGPELAAADLALVARSLGHWQGGAAGEGDWGPPAVPNWWSRGWTWAYTGSRPVGRGGYHDDRAWGHRLVREGFGDGLERIRSGFSALHADLGRWQQVAARLPLAPAHQDAWANNVILTGTPDPEVVLIDWSFCGAAHLGADAGNLVPDGLLDHYGDPDSYAEADRMVTDAYLAGLAGAGWDGPDDLVRLGMCLAPAKFAWLPAWMVANADWSGPTGYGGADGIDHLSVFRRRATVFAAMLDQIDEARELAVGLGLWP